MTQVTARLSKVKSRNTIFWQFVMPSLQVMWFVLLWVLARVFIRYQGKTSTLPLAASRLSPALVSKSPALSHWDFNLTFVFKNWEEQFLWKQCKW